MNDPWAVLAAIVGVAVGYVLLPVVAETFLRVRAKRRFVCPERGVTAEVGVDARRAALAAAVGRPALQVKTCSLWPERSGCRRSCLSRFEVANPASQPSPVS